MFLDVFQTTKGERHIIMTTVFYAMLARNTRL